MIYSRTYRVAGLDFCVEFPDGSIQERLQNYSPFVVESDTQPLFTLRFCDRLSPEGMSPVPLPNDENPAEPRIDIFTALDGSRLFEMYPTGRSPLAGRLLLSADFSEAVLDSTGTFAINNAMMITYALRGAMEGILEMHSSTVVNDGIAYMFLGVSGTGKSTHSRLWMENMPGTWLLNDDNPVIRVQNGDIRVYGTPWSGKTPCYRNESAPIGAIVSLHQAKRNIITRQSVFEGYTSIFSSCSGLKFDGGFLDILHENIAAVATAVPCFDLDCLPDGDAAIVCHDAVSSAVPSANG